MNCPFCQENWPNLDVVENHYSRLIINPINPVTEGHVLVIGAWHTESAIEVPLLAGSLVTLAAEYIKRHELQANIITSVGPDATQTVFHTHVHVVPRRAGDGLKLPWTDQKE